MIIEIYYEDGKYKVREQNGDDVLEEYESRGDAINAVLANFPDAVIEHVHGDHEL